MSKLFYGFYLNMWTYKRVTEAQLERAVEKGQLTATEKATIMATPQIDLPEE